MDSLEERFEQWKKMVELQARFLEALGVYKLDTAKAELVKAVAAGQWALASIKAQIAQELSQALGRLRRLRSRTRKRVERITRQAKALSKIRSGEDLALSQATQMWAAFTVFERLTPISVLDGLVETELHPTAKQATSYVDLRRPGKSCQPPPDDIDNLHALLRWIKSRRYMPKRGSQAYRQVVNGIARIAGVAGAEIEKLQAALRQMEHGTYDTWQPLALAALPDSIDIKKIIKLGSR